MGLDENEELVPQNITAYNNVAFDIILPGVIDINGTVSFVLSNQPDTYVVYRDGLKLQSSVLEEDVAQWTHSASFKITQNKFYQVSFSYSTSWHSS